MARWGDAEQLLQLEKILCRLVEIDKGSAGIRVWLSLNWYPVIAIMYAAGISALSARRYAALHVLLATKVRTNQLVVALGEKPIAVAAINGIRNIEDDFRRLPGHSSHAYARSEYLHEYLKPLLDDVLFLGEGYELLFDRFELFSR